MDHVDAHAMVFDTNILLLCVSFQASKKGNKSGLDKGKDDNHERHERNSFESGKATLCGNHGNVLHARCCCLLAFFVLLSYTNESYFRLLKNMRIHVPVRPQ